MSLIGLYNEDNILSEKKEKLLNSIRERSLEVVFTVDGLIASLEADKCDTSVELISGAQILVEGVMAILEGVQELADIPATSEVIAFLESAEKEVISAEKTILPEIKLLD